MHFCTPPGSAVRTVLRGLKLALAASLWYGTIANADQSSVSSSLPSAVAALQAFRGRIDYTMHRTDAGSISIAGELALSSEDWTLDENAGASSLHASNAQSWLRAGGTTLYFDDAFAVPALANAWALLLAQGAGQAVQADRSGTSWTLGTDLRVYPDANGDHISGLVDLRPHSNASFSFGDWIFLNGLWLPQSIVRFTSGAMDATFVVDSYRVTWAATSNSTQGWRSIPVQTVQTQLMPTARADGAWRTFRFLFAWLFCGFLLAAWFRRDALVERICRHLMADPRAWRSEGVSVFVSPEGMLSFEGRTYRVGADFFNRPARVQSSPLFIRVSAAGTSRSVILARKFSASWLERRRRAAGFTLLEALVATALFSSVVVAAVLPTLAVLAHADRVALLHETATQLAVNALVDEEAALEYGTSSISDTSGVITQNGMQVTVNVSPSSIAAMHQVTVSVDDSNGRTLARIATMVGPPVPAPLNPTQGK